MKCVILVARECSTPLNEVESFKIDKFIRYYEALIDLLKSEQGE